MQSVSSICEAVPELWGVTCLTLLHSSMALARSSAITDVRAVLGGSTASGRRISAASDIVQWVTAVWAPGPHDGAQRAATCLQALAWETAAPHIPGGTQAGAEYLSVYPHLRVMGQIRAEGSQKIPREKDRHFCSRRRKLSQPQISSSTFGPILCVEVQDSQRPQCTLPHSESIHQCMP